MSVKWDMYCIVLFVWNSRWTMYSKQLMEVPLDYALLFQLLDDLTRSWGDQENPLSRDEVSPLNLILFQSKSY